MLARNKYLVALLPTMACAIGGGDELVVEPMPGEPVPVNCLGSYNEKFDLDNGPRDRVLRPEPSGMVLNPGLEFTLCGELNPAFAQTTSFDQDFFAFQIAGPNPVDVRALMRPAQSLNAARITLWNQNLGLLQSSVVRGGRGIVTRDGLPPGDYLVSVELASDGGDIVTQPIGYTITINQDVPACALGAGSFYAETLDGLDHRGNDALSINYVPQLNVTLSTGAPELTNLILGPGTATSIVGQSASVTGTPYLDGDTYQFAIDPATNEVEVGLSWTEDGVSDLDVFLFVAGDPSRELSQAAGSLVRIGGGESLTTAVVPGNAFWVWVGRAATGEPVPEVNYQLAICARSNLPL